MSLIQKFKSFKKEPSDLDVRVHYKDVACLSKLSSGVEHLLSTAGARPIVIVCIGTDRSTGDSLGPLVGSKLKHTNFSSVSIYGTLDYPVHAVNLSETYETIQSTYQDPFIIGVDACLGRYNQVGVVTVGNGPVLPGAGVNKALPPIGEAHITGIVNVSGYMEYFVLQNTRLHVVMSMADLISHSIIKSLTLSRKPQTNVNFQGINKSV